MAELRWSYAINQWKPQFDDFVRREDHERALKTLAIAGFDGVELAAGTGRWEPLGNPLQLAANFGSVDGFRQFLAECGVPRVSSWFWDPHQRSMEHLTGPLSPYEPDDLGAIVERAAWYCSALAELGGSVLVVPASLPAWVSPMSGDLLEVLAACWNAVGGTTLSHGIRTAVHVDFLSPFRDEARLADLLDALDPALVGLAVDTGELAVAGLDPVAVLRRHRDRVWHVQLKDALATDSAGEYLTPHAEFTLLARGGHREVPRWFAEPGEDGGMVDCRGVVQELLDSEYAGWVVFESDQSPHPATSVLLASYLMQRTLRPLLTQARPSLPGSSGAV